MKWILIVAYLHAPGTEISGHWVSSSIEECRNTAKQVSAKLIDAGFPIISIKCVEGNPS